MTRKQRRGILIGAGVVILSIAAILVLFAFQSSIVFFHTPSDITAKKPADGQRIRLGGLVKEGSIIRGAGTDVSFKVTDTIETINVAYSGILPDLFREGQGVIAEGMMAGDGQFKADTVLAKHDETYMPPEVAKALKEKGVKLGQGAVHETRDQPGMQTP